MTDPFAIGTVHLGWTIKSVQAGGTAPRYGVTSGGREGTLTYYPFSGPQGLVHQALGQRLQRWAGVAHPALVPVGVGRIAEGSETGVYVIVPSLERLDEAPIPAEKANAALRRAAEALTAFHEKQLPHGELDAWSLARQPDGQLGLQPPGLRPPLPGLKRLGLEVDPRYASPEVLDGRPATLQADLFSLGLVYYRLLTGKPPVAVRDPGDALAARGKLLAPPLPSGLPKPVQGLYRKLTAADPRERPANAKELLTDLGRVEKGQIPTRHALPKREVRAESIGGALLAVTLGLGLAGGAFYYATTVLAVSDPLAGLTFPVPKGDAAAVGSAAPGK